MTGAQAAGSNAIEALRSRAVKVHQHKPPHAVGRRAAQRSAKKIGRASTRLQLQSSVMAKSHNIFISWSGSRSRYIADALRGWLPTVLQAAKPWMSERDIDKGARGSSEISRALDGMKVGIVCLTPENLEARWILYEAGALSKTINEKTRLCTYLLGDLKHEHVEPPLSDFQHTRPEKEDTRRLIQSINKAIGGKEPLAEVVVNQVFDRGWPDLHSRLTSMPAPENVVEAKRNSDEILTEVLELCRSYLPMIDDDPLGRYRPARTTGVITTTEIAGPEFVVPDIVPRVLRLKKIFCVELTYDNDVKRIEGTRAEEPYPGQLIIYNGDAIAARFTDGVQQWWGESSLE
jgi:hypothetical protein